MTGCNPTAASPTPKTAKSCVAAKPGTTVAVAFSGGRDSLALLHATCRAAVTLGLQVVALHVHHGLQPEADGWVRQAQALCARWRRRGWPLRLRWGRLTGQPAVGDSIEAWARAGRQALLNRLAQEEGATLLLLAQHRRDQAETVLLQALRGGGPAGLSAMPAGADRQGLHWARPWLAQPREAIEAYVRRHRLKPLEDPSNADPRWARNRLRLMVWPALQAAFDDTEIALVAVAQRAQEAQAVLAEVALLDLAGLVDEAGGLQVDGWQALSPGRQANALRAWWLAQAGHGMPAALLRRLLAEVRAGGSGVWPAGRDGRCWLYRGRLRHQVGVAAPEPVPQRPPLSLDLSTPGRWSLPGWGGAIEARVCLVGGVPAERLRQVSLAARSGGERFQSHAKGLPRSLKLQFQAAAVPAQARGGPLVWSDGRLLFVPGLGMDARAWAAGGVPQLRLHWWPDAVLSGPAQPPG